MIDAIYNRRSIRKYTNIDMPKEVIEKVLQAAILAPSSKNNQPWKFIVVSGTSKKDMILAMKEGLTQGKSENALLPNSKHHLKSAEYSLQIMSQAPVTIFALNTLGIKLSSSITTEERIYEICNTQSIGAALENMTLAATELGLGSLWICDIFFAYHELTKWFSTSGELIAAMTLGYPNESPIPRPRKNIVDVVEWRL